MKPNPKENNESTYRTSILMDSHVNNLYARLYTSKYRKRLSFKLDTRITTASDLMNIGLIKGLKEILKELGIDEHDI